MLTYPLPSDTSDALRRSLHSCRNPGLVFDRYAPKLQGARAKQEALETVRRCNPDRQAVEACRKRLRALAEATNAITFQAKTDWRFVTGLGRNTPLEVGFTFHRLYGFPVIPGSGLKGLARSWAQIRLREQKPDTAPEEDSLFVRVFGCASEDAESGGCAGGAIFYDAVPLDEPELALDVMTPHFQDYYSDDANRVPPADNQDPVPIPFLVVRAGVRFGFTVGWRGEPNPQVHAEAVEWLQAGLAHLGAGAKTAAGYGYFVELQT